MLRVVEALEQRVRAHQVGAQDQLAVGLERVRAVGDAVEDGARLHLVEHAVDVERHERVELAHVARRAGPRAARRACGWSSRRRRRGARAERARGWRRRSRWRRARGSGPAASGCGRRASCRAPQRQRPCARGGRGRCVASAPAERPWRSCRKSALPVSPAGERRTPARTRRVARRVLGDDLGRQRADAAVDVVRLDRERERDAGERLHEVVRGRRPDARDDHDAGGDAVRGQQRLGLDRRRAPCCRARRARRPRRRRARARGRSRSARRGPRWPVPCARAADMPGRRDRPVACTALAVCGSSAGAITASPGSGRSTATSSSAQCVMPFGP